MTIAGSLPIVGRYGLSPLLTANGSLLFPHPVQAKPNRKLVASPFCGIAQNSERRLLWWEFYASIVYETRGFPPRFHVLFLAYLLLN